MYDGQPQSSTILSMLPSDDDFRSLQEAMPPQWTPLLRGTCLADARQLLNTNPVDVIVTDIGLADDYGWKDMLEASRAGSASRPLIVASRCADEFLWAEVLNLGGFDVLNQPFDKEEVLWVLGAALRQRHRARRAQRNADVATPVKTAGQRSARA